MERKRGARIECLRGWSLPLSRPDSWLYTVGALPRATRRMLANVNCDMADVSALSDLAKSFTDFAAFLLALERLFNSAGPPEESPAPSFQVLSRRKREGFGWPLASVKNPC